MDALLPLLGFVTWTLSLVLSVVVIRTVWVLAGRQQAHTFRSGEEHGPPWYWRLNRAHINSVETLVPFAVVVGAGWALDVEGLAPLAWGVVAARVAQSILHVAMNTHLSVSVRATFFLVQLGLIGAMLVRVGAAV